MRVRHLAAVGILLLPLCAAAGIEDITASDSVAALKTALNQGTAHAIESLGVTDGFLKNPRSNPVATDAREGREGMRLFGMGDQADALVVAMNRAAEAAVPEAKSLLVSAVKQMSLADARQILTAVTTPRRSTFARSRTTSSSSRFLPIVKQHTDRSRSRSSTTTLSVRRRNRTRRPKDANVEGYVTRKALDGLFTMIAEEERAIRKDPLGQSSQILEKVFGSIKL